MKSFMITHHNHYAPLNAAPYNEFGCMYNRDSWIHVNPDRNLSYHPQHILNELMENISTDIEDHINIRPAYYTYAGPRLSELTFGLFVFEAELATLIKLTYN